MRVIQEFLESGVQALFENCPTHPSINTDLRVTYTASGPEVVFGGNSAVGFDIHLTAENNHWCQHLYQFAHEACHVLAQFQQHIHSNQWIEECLCETASMFACQRMANSGKLNQGPCAKLTTGEIPPRPYWKALQEYLDNLLTDPARQFTGFSMQQWFRQQETILRTNPYRRDLNELFANKLYAHLISHPNDWAAVEFLNTSPCGSTDDALSTYLRRWRAATPKLHRSLVDFVEGCLL